MSENSVDTPESSPAKPPKAKPIDIKKPKPSDIEQFIDKPTEQGGIDQFDVKGFTSLISTTSGGYDESDDQRLSKSLDDALDLHSQRLGITKDELESGLVELKINPGKVASDIVSKKQDPSKVYESLTKRTLAGEDAQKQRVKKRGELIAELGGLRADRKIGRTVRETGIVHESLKDRPSPTLQIQEGKAGFFGTDIEKEESAPKPGDVAYDELLILNNAMEAAAETDASMNRVIEMRNRYGTDELGAAKYINERALDILNSKNISVDGQFGTVDENLNAIQNASDDYRYQVNKAKDRAVNEIAMWKTIGVWTAPTFIRWHGVQDSSELKAKDVFKPTVEIVGLNKFGRPIGRVQGGLQWGMEINDALQSAATGIISEQQGTLRERALKGVAERQNFLEAALASDMYKRGGTAGKIAAGTSGFLASVLFPDLTFGVAGAYSAGRKSVTKALTMGKAKKAISLKEDAAKALVAGLDGSRSELRKAAGLSSEARKIAPKAMDEVDTNDFNVSRRLGRQNPDILNGKEGKELASKLPGELGELKVNMHPSIRRRIARTGDPSDDIRQAPGIAYDEAYDYGRHLDLVDEARTMVNAQDNAIYTRFIKKKLTGISTLLQKGLKEIPGINRSRVFSLAQDVTKLARDPDAWKRATLDTLNEEMVRAGSKDPDDFMKAVESVLDEMIETSKKVIDESDDFDEMAMLINRAEEAIKTNIESRAVAHALQREIMAGQLGLKVAPIIAESTGKVDELMGRKMTGGNLEYMSEQAVNFMDQIVEKTEISKEHALEAAVILDLRAKMEARKTGFNEAKYWKERIAGIGDRAEFMRKLYAPPAPYDAKAVAIASLPDGFTVELSNNKWLVKNAQGKTYSDAKTDALDAAAESIDKLVDEGVMTRSDLDLSATRVGPLLLGQPLSVAEDVIRRLPIEYAMAHTDDGVHVIRQTSNAPNYVAFSSPEMNRLMKAENLVFTHNHPSGGAFSDADIIASMFIDAREIRATQPNGGVWSMVFPDGFGDYSEAVLREKYGSLSAVPKAVRDARRDFERDIRNAASFAAREASEKVRSQSAKEALDRTGAAEAWSAFYSEALVGTADEAGVLSGGRLGEVFERRGIKRVLTRVEPEDTAVRVRPGSESTFGETARRAATQQGIDLLLQLKNSPAGQARQVDLANNVLARGADGRVTAKASPEFIDPAKVMSDPRYARTDGGELIVLNDAIKASDEIASKVGQANNRIAKTLTEWNPQSVQLDGQFYQLTADLSRAKMALTHGGRTFVKQRGFSIPKVSSSIAYVQSARKSLRRLAEKLPKDVHEKILDELQSLDQLMDDHVFASMIGPPKIARRAGAQEIVYTGPAPKLSDVRKIMRESELEMADIDRQQLARYEALPKDESGLLLDIKADDDEGVRLLKRRRDLKNEIEVLESIFDAVRGYRKDDAARLGLDELGRDLASPGDKKYFFFGSRGTTLNKGVSDVFKRLGIDKPEQYFELLPESSQATKEQVLQQVNASPWFHGTASPEVVKGETTLAEWERVHSGTAAGSMLGHGLYLASNPEVSIRYAGSLYRLNEFHFGLSRGKGALKTVDVKVRDVIDLRTDTLSEMLQQLENSGAKVAVRKINQFIESEAEKLAISRKKETTSIFGLKRYQNQVKVVKSELLNDWGALYTWKELMRPENFLNDAEFTEDLLKAGIDGVLHHGMQDGDVLVLFDPNATTLQSAKKTIQREGRVTPEQIFYQKPTTQQTDFEFREVGDNLVEITSRQIRDAVGDTEGIDAGLTFKVEDNVLRVESAAIPEALRGRGFGTELYLKALSRAADAGLGFASDISPSPDALAVYERLIDAGVPLRRKMVEGPDGNMVRQYEATADELKGLNLTPGLAGPPTVEQFVGPEQLFEITKKSVDDIDEVLPEIRRLSDSNRAEIAKYEDFRGKFMAQAASFSDRKFSDKEIEVLIDPFRSDAVRELSKTNPNIYGDLLTELRRAAAEDDRIADYLDRASAAHEYTKGGDPAGEIAGSLDMLQNQLKQYNPENLAESRKALDEATKSFNDFNSELRAAEDALKELEATRPEIVLRGEPGHDEWAAAVKKWNRANLSKRRTLQKEIERITGDSYIEHTMQRGRFGFKLRNLEFQLDKARKRVEFLERPPLENDNVRYYIDELKDSVRGINSPSLDKETRNKIRRIIDDVEAKPADDPTDPRILKQEIDDTAKGAVEFMDDGRAIIYAFEGADFSTLVHEIGHIIRRDLDPADMDEVLSWVKSLGADVTVTAGRFKGAPDEVRKAEEFFAEAFENYIMTGKPPVKGLEDMFSRMKQFMLDIYKTISPVAKPSPEIKKTFDKLLTVEPPTQPVLKRVMKLIGTEIFGPTDERKLNVIRELSREAQRLGVPNADYDTLIDQFENTGKITLDKGIFFSRYGAGGKSEFGPNDLADLRKSMEVEIASEAAQFRPGVNTTASSQGLTELKPTERIEQMLRGDSAASKIGAVAKSTFMGGDVTAERGLGNLVPEVRASVETATREVQQAAGEVIRLTAEAAEGPGSTGYSKLLDYLTGERVQFEKSGRNVFTSGHDSVAAIFDSVRLFMTDRMAGDGRLDVLIELANRAARGERLELTGLGKQTAFIGSKELRLKDAMEEAWDTTFRNKSSPMFFNDLLMAVAPKVHAGGNLEPKHFQDFTEIVMYYSGQSVRNGDKFRGTSRQLAEGLLADLRKTFDAESASRVGILLGVHGQADRARQLWAGLGIAVDKTARDYYIRFLNGEDIPPQYIGRVKDLVKRFGVQTNFVETSLLDTTFYVPAQARARLNQAITRGIDPEVRGIAASESDIKGIKGVILRYMKTRMTRGGVAVRQRYFLMNTIDHFVQMAIINGFRPALASTTRLVFQDVMILPGVARTIDLMERAARAGGVPRNIAEGLRRKLQTGGDTIGRALAASKYNLNVNPVLEGADGFVRLGGNVYSYKEIREIAVQEGIFASFDTSQLSNSVKRSGRELLTKNKEEATKVGMLGAKTDRLLDQTGEFLTQVVADTSEAWAERERLGAMVSLMEFGVSPRVAARLTIDALYDYAGSMTKMDRAWFVSLALPFWAFQKNANRQIINSMLSPGGAYRMGVIRRAQERGADLLTDLLYYSVTDEYGVDTEAMESANEELYEEYITLRNRLEEYYNGPDKVPESMKTAFRMWMSGRSQMVDNGKIVDLEATFADKVAMGGSGAPVTKFREFTRAPVSKSARRSYLRDRTAVAVPVSLQKEAVRRYYAGIESKTKDHPYIEVFVPDSTINAGFRHIANLTAFYVLALDKSTNFIQDRAFDEDSDQTGIAEVSPLTALRQVVDLERSLIAGDVIREVTGKPGYPRRVHPWIADLTEQTFAVKLYRTSPKDDTVGLPDEREGVEFQEERVYMFPGAWQIAFDNSPLGELNNMMMQQYDFKVPEGSYFPQVRLKVTALERESARGRMIAWARALTGVQTAETSGREAARREEPTRLTVTKRPR